MPGSYGFMPGMFGLFFFLHFVVAIGITIYFFVLFSRIAASLQRIADRIEQIDIKQSGQ